MDCAGRFFGKLAPSPTLWEPSMPATKTRTAKPAASAVAPTYRSEHQRDVINRLKRIEGQVRGLIDMVEGGRSCEDVAQQMAAARKAMDKTFFRMMACTMMEAAATGPSDNSSAEEEMKRATAILERYA